MTKFTDHLWRDLVREHGPTLAHADRDEPGRARRPRRRVLAGSTLGLAGVGAALVLALGGSTASPAYAITQKDNGTVFVKVNFGGARTLSAADQMLIAKYHETALVNIAPGPATTAGPVNCTPTPDPYAPGDASPTGPAVTILLGDDGTGAIPSGDTGAGTVHLNGCRTYLSSPHSNTGSGNSGNSGNS
jgi:hypothetical protein